MALYGKIKEAAGGGEWGETTVFLQTSPSLTFSYWNLNPLHTLLAENFKYSFSIQAHNRNVLYLLTWARTNVVQARKNSLLFRRVAKQPSHTVYNCSYLHGHQERAGLVRVRGSKPLSHCELGPGGHVGGLPPWSPEHPVQL